MKLITIKDLRDKSRIPFTRLRRGYDIDAVNDLLDQCADTLASVTVYADRLSRYCETIGVDVTRAVLTADGKPGRYSQEVSLARVGAIDPTTRIEDTFDMIARQRKETK